MIFNFDPNFDPASLLRSLLTPSFGRSFGSASCDCGPSMALIMVLITIYNYEKKKL